MTIAALPIRSALIVAAILASAAPSRADDPPPLAPAEALASIRVKAGLKVELVACEPLIVDPVAVDWGADGTLWVCEMHDYPTGLDGKFQPGGRIKALRDTDGDGQYDKATVFLDGLPFPTGVMAWRKGVLVCAAPEILYAEDTDGDGRADVRKTLYRGFATENYQARVNGLSYGLDNWVYGANGLIGGVIRGEASGKAVDIGGRDFRIRPDSGAMEPASGLSQQGRIHDDFGDQFGNSNSVLLSHYPFPDHYARRNPRVAVPSPSVYVPRYGDSARLFPASVTLRRYNEPQSANRVTSACGPGLYRDDLLGPDYAGNAFICEPVHNLVHREILTADGVTFAGHRAEDEHASEFLASTDSWFRPVQARTGPDGALYVVDMYRFVIEHPRWIAPEVLKGLDVRAGSDKGRIYRVVRDGVPPREVPDLDRLSTESLARAIDSPNGTLRDNVQRMLVHKGDRRAGATLMRIARESKHPAARGQALGALDGLGLLEDATVLAALRDPSPGVRAQASRLCEGRFANPEIGPALAGLIEDPSPKVRFQVALSLGEWDDPLAGRALGRLAAAHSRDAWLVAAVHSSAVRRPGEALSEVLAAGLEPEAARRVVGPLVATAARGADIRAIAASLADAKSAPAAWRLGALADLLDASPRDRAVAGPEFRPALLAARSLAADQAAPPSDRAIAARLLGRHPAFHEEDLDVLADLLGPRRPAEVQRAAIASLARVGDAGSLRLLSAWGGLGPDARLRALDVLLARPRGATDLLAAIERGDLARGEIDATNRQKLLAHEDASIRKRASALWAIAARPEVLATYRAAAAKGGDALRGARTFDRVCAACHRLEGRGYEVGPDLAALTDRTPEALLPSILDPNREVDARYVAYVAALNDGRVLTGVIGSETGNAITLKGQGGDPSVILRADLDGLRSTGRSLMPEGLERDVTPDDCADLLAYLARNGPRAKSLEGNAPRLVTPSGDGSLRLDAATAEVYGPSLTLETEFANLGYWQSPQDRAAWSFRMDRPGRYAVVITMACAEDSAGNGFRIRSGDATLAGKVAGTGPGWSVYREVVVGEMEFAEGVHRIEVRPEGAPRGALMDLRAVVLRPK